MKKIIPIYIVCALWAHQASAQTTHDFLVAASNGDPVAQYNLAQCYRYGWGAEPNNTSYRHYLRLSAEGGEERARGELADNLTPIAPNLASYWRGEESSTLPYDYTYRSFDSGCYYGEIYRGTRDGYGTFVWDSGTIYVGRWENGERYGLGLSIFDTMTIFCTHTTSANGYGAALITAPDTHWAGAKGSLYYVGYLERDLPNGMGTLYDTEGRVTYYGAFADGIPTGPYPTAESFSSYRWVREELANGDTWEGEMTDGVRDGFGIYTWGDGSRWYGFWQDGMRDGSGLYIRSDGALMSGTWENGELKTDN